MTIRIVCNERTSDVCELRMNFALCLMNINYLVSSCVSESKEHDMRTSVPSFLNNNKIVHCKITDKATVIYSATLTNGQIHIHVFTLHLCSIIYFVTIDITFFCINRLLKCIAFARAEVKCPETNHDELRLDYHLSLKIDLLRPHL